MSIEADDSDNGESRSYSRIPCFARALYRHMSHPEEPQICPGSFNAEDKSLKERFAASGAPEAITSFLLQLDSKLDRILSQMNKDALSSYFPNQFVVLDLSAAGLLVQAGGLKAGEFVEVVLFLGEFPSVVVSGVAQVLRPGKPVPGVGSTFALKFTRLRDSEREQIVRFVFREERERIRSEKFK